MHFAHALSLTVTEAKGSNLVALHNGQTALHTGHTPPTGKCHTPFFSLGQFPIFSLGQFGLSTLESGFSAESTVLPGMHAVGASPVVVDSVVGATTEMAV